MPTLTDLSKKMPKSLRRVITDLMKTNHPFHKHISLFLHKGGRIQMPETIDAYDQLGDSVLGQYFITENILYISKKLTRKLYKKTPKDVADSVIGHVLRHEARHAFDFKKEDNIDFSKLEKDSRVFNFITNELHRIFNSSMAGNNLPPFLQHSSGTYNILTTKEWTDADVPYFIINPSSKIPLFAINTVGLTQDNWIHTGAFNPKTAMQAAYRNYKSRGGKLTKTQLIDRLIIPMKDLYKVTNSYLDFWEKLTPEDANKLEEFLFLRQSFINAVVNDPRGCKEIFTQCMDNLERDCLSTVLTCQEKTGNLIKERTLLELEAGVAERGNRIQIESVDMTEGKAPEKPKKVDNYNFKTNFIIGFIEEILNHALKPFISSALLLGLIKHSLTAAVMYYGLTFSLSQIIMTKAFSIASSAILNTQLANAYKALSGAMIIASLAYSETWADLGLNLASLGGVSAGTVAGKLSCSAARSARQAFFTPAPLVPADEAQAPQEAAAHHANTRHRRHRHRTRGH